MDMLKRGIALLKRRDFALLMATQFCAQGGDGVAQGALAKLIVFGTTRERCIMRLKRALEEFVVEGMKTTVPLHQRIVRDPEFLAGEYTIKWLESWLEANPE